MALARKLIPNEPSRNLVRGAAILFLSLVPLSLLGQEGNRPAVSEATPIRAFVPTVALSNDQIRELIQRASERDLVNEKRQRDYTYIKKERTSKRNENGDLQSVESKTYDVMFLYGEQVEHLIARNGQRLSDKEATNEEEKIQKLMDKRKNESEADRQGARDTLGAAGLHRPARGG